MCSPQNEEFKYSVKYTFPVINNVAEYEALIRSLKLVKKIRARQVIVHVDSQLVAKQVTREYKTKDPLIFSHRREVQFRFLNSLPSRIGKSPKSKTLRLMLCQN